MSRLQTCFALSALLAFIHFSSAAKLAKQVTRPLIPTAESCTRAFRQCDFRFTGYNDRVPTFDISGKPDRVFTPRIVSTAPGEFLGVLSSDIVAPEFVFDHSARPITSFGSQRFSSTHFLPLSIPRKHRFSGISYQTFQDGQLSVADGKCIRMYFKGYQTVNLATGNVIEVMRNVPRVANKCVVFWASSRV